MAYSLKLITNDEELKAALKRIDQIIDSKPGTKEYEELEAISVFVKYYEDLHTAILPPDPLEAIKVRLMDVENLDPISLFGSKSIASEVLSGKRLLSKNLIEKLHVTLGIPYRTLMKAALKQQEYAK